MFVKIGSYKNWYGPYQIADLLQKVGVSEERCEKIGDKLNEIKWLVSLCNWIYSKRERKIKVRIDDYDVWGLDHTLSCIIAPALECLRAKKQGSPYTDDEDVPEELRSSKAEPKESDWDTDSNHSKRWNWILNEMIWAFNEIKNGEWEDQFHSGKIDIKWVPTEDGKYNTMEKGPEDTHAFDKEGYDKHYQRIQNGLRLFAKYYFGLWD